VNSKQVRLSKSKNTLIVILVAGISLLHYLSDKSPYYYHVFYGKLYCLPIVLAGFWSSPLLYQHRFTVTEQALSPQQKVRDIQQHREQKKPRRNIGGALSIVT